MNTAGRLARRIRRSARALTAREVEPGAGAMLGRAMACGADVVSVDLFDTLVYRQCCRPEDVALHVQARCACISRRLDALSWRALRSSTEAELAKAAEPAEITLAGIYSALAGRLGLTPAEAAEALACELQAERALIAPHEEVVNELRLCHRAGLRVVVTTDTPLPLSFIRELAGSILPFDHDILCSSATGRTKRSGQAFQLLAERYGSARIAHFGDNLHADVLMAGAGVRAFRVRHRRCDFLDRNRLCVEHLRALGICRIETPCDVPAAGPMLDLCQRELAWRWAAVMADVVADVARYAREIEADEIWFLSRDGESLFTAVQQASFDFGCRIRYVHSSRAASYPIAAVRDPGVFEQWTGRPANASDLERGEQLIQAYRSLAGTAKARILTVDTGWRGRVQACLQMALPEHRVFGYYVSLAPGKAPGAVEASRTYLRWDRRLINQASVEALAGFAGPSCIGWRQEAAGTWEPVFKEADGDAAPEVYRAALVRYLRSHLQQVGIDRPTTDVMRGNTLRSICAFPDAVVAQAFQHWGLGSEVAAAPKSALVKGGSAGPLARFIGREAHDNLWPELAMWSLSPRPWAVGLMQRIMSLRKSVQIALGWHADSQLDAAPREARSPAGRHTRPTLPGRAVARAEPTGPGQGH